MEETSLYKIHDSDSCSIINLKIQNYNISAMRSRTLSVVEGGLAHAQRGARRPRGARSTGTLVDISSV